MNRDKLIKFLATGFNVGLSSIAPGTMGTLVAAFLTFVILNLGVEVNFPLVFMVTVIGIYLSHHAEYLYEEKDAQQIVIDEIAGFLVAMYGFSVNMIIPAFILFRLFDILKPPPIRNLQEFHGGVGIMLDDILAGILANILLQVILFFV